MDTTVCLALDTHLVKGVLKHLFHIRIKAHALPVVLDHHFKILFICHRVNVNVPGVLGQIVKAVLLGKVQGAA